MIKILLSRKLGELRVTQTDLARRTGIRPTTINEMYHELCERVNLEHLDLICVALDCDLGEIIERIPRVAPAFRFCLDNSTLAHAIPIRYSFFYLSHIIVTPTHLRMYHRNQA